MVSIVDTVEYGQWLDNFPSQYHPTAEILAKALHYLDESTFTSNLTNQIVQDFDDGLITSPALVIPVRTGPEMGKLGPERTVIFENVSPSDPLPVPDTGSEALCANIIRNLAKGEGERLGMIPLPHTLDELRTRKVRSIVLVSDYAGSGSQVIETAKIWTRNRSIRSWHSYHLLTIHVVVHSASIAAREALNREPSIDRLSMVSVAPDFDTAGWTVEQQQDVKEFCERFAKNRRGSLGWKGSAGLFVMQHKAPNNMPIILWQTRGKGQRRGGWYPLFPNGRVPGGIVAALAAQNQVRRERGSGKGAARNRVLGPSWSSALVALHGGARTPERISALAAISLAQSTQVLAELTDGGYVDDRGYLTDLGRGLLTDNAGPMSRYRLRGSAQPYYPQALRRVGDI